MAWELLKTDYVDARFDGLRQYLQIQNENGTLSFEDVTAYITRENSFFGAKDANAINEAVNAIMAALESGTDLYTVFQQFFETQKEEFAEQYEEEIQAMLDNEQTRVNAENMRISNENLRISNENVRQQNTANAIRNAEVATNSTIDATNACTSVTERAERALQNEEQLNITLASATQMHGEVEQMESNVENLAAQVQQDKEEIDETIQNSLLAEAEQILNSVRSYFERAEALYQSMYLECDGETPYLRAVTVVTIDGGTPQMRNVNAGIEFDGGTPMSRILAV